MKAIGFPPSDPRAAQMNDAQWLWCYFNQLEDEKEENELAKSRLDYLAFFINPTLAERVNELNGQKKEQPKKGPRYKKNDVHNSDDFEKEAYAASKGYDPDSGLTIDEFLEQLNADKQQEVDIVNDDFEALLASGEFAEIADPTQGIGNPNEDVDDFITRALMYEDYLDNNKSEGIPEEDLRSNDGASFNAPHGQGFEHEDYDLDIFEVDDE